MRVLQGRGVHVDYISRYQEMDYCERIDISFPVIHWHADVLYILDISYPSDLERDNLTSDHMLSSVSS